MAVRRQNSPHYDTSPFPLAYKYYRQAVEESRKLATSPDADSSHLLPREIVEEGRRAANQTIEQLRQDIEARDEQLHNAETRIRKLQESGMLPQLSSHVFPEPLTETLLRNDLKVEIERSKALNGRASSKPPTDISHQHQAAVTSLYEDMTNILITSVKIERDPQLLGGPTIYQCVYTQRSETSARSEYPVRNNALVRSDCVL